MYLKYTKVKVRKQMMTVVYKRVSKRVRNIYEKKIPIPIYRIRKTTYE